MAEITLRCDPRHSIFSSTYSSIDADLGGPRCEGKIKMKGNIEKCKDCGRVVSYWGRGQHKAIVGMWVSFGCPDPDTYCAECFRKLIRRYPGFSSFMTIRIGEGVPQEVWQRLPRLFDLPQLREDEGYDYEVVEVPAPDVSVKAAAGGQSERKASSNLRPAVVASSYF